MWLGDLKLGRSWKNGRHCTLKDRNSAGMKEWGIWENKRMWPERGILEFRLLYSSKKVPNNGEDQDLVLLIVGWRRELTAMRSGY